VFLLFEPDLEYDGIPGFSVEIGLREFNRTSFFGIEDDEEETFRIPKIIEELIVTKDISLNERVVFAGFVIGVGLYLLKTRFCPKSWDVAPNKIDLEKIHSTDVHEAEGYVQSDEEDYKDKIEYVPRLEQTIEPLESAKSHAHSRRRFVLEGLPQGMAAMDSIEAPATGEKGPDSRSSRNKEANMLISNE